MAAGQVLATASAILKEVYETSIQDQLQSESVGLKRIERTSEGVTNRAGGRFVVFPIRTRRNHGIGGRREMETLPTPGQQGYARAEVPLKYLYGGVRLSGQAIELTNSDYQAFASILDEEVTGLKNDLVKDQNRQFYGSGLGTLAVATADGASAVTVANTQYLEVGQVFDLIDGTTVANASPVVKTNGGSKTIASITGNVVAYDAPDATAAANDVLVRTGSANREPIGLEAIVKDSGILYNINPANEPTWVSYVAANGGTARPLSEGLMIATADVPRSKGSKVSVGFCNLGVRRAYFQLLVQQRRYTNTQEFAGGFSGLAFTTDKGDIPIVVDTDCPPNVMYFVDESEIKIYREKDWSWMDRDGSKWQRVNQLDAYEAMMYCYQEFGTHKRNAHAKLADITEA